MVSPFSPPVPSASLLNLQAIVPSAQLPGSPQLVRALALGPAERNLGAGETSCRRGTAAQNRYWLRRNLRPGRVVGVDEVHAVGPHLAPEDWRVRRAPEPDLPAVRVGLRDNGLLLT